MDVRISDHLAIYCTRKITKVPLEQGKNSIRIPSLKHYSEERFIQALGEKDWSVVLNCEDVDEARGMFKVPLYT